MISHALTIVVNELNRHLASYGTEVPPDEARLGNMAEGIGAAGQNGRVAREVLILSIVNMKEEKVLKAIATSLARKNEAANDRIFFRLLLDERDQVVIQMNQPQYKVIGQQNVAALTAFSDGIGAATEHLLKNKYETQPAAARSELMDQLQGTADDKSICFVLRSWKVNPRWCRPSPAPEPGGFLLHPKFTKGHDWNWNHCVARPFVRE